MRMRLIPLLLAAVVTATAAAPALAQQGAPSPAVDGQPSPSRDGGNRATGQPPGTPVQLDLPVSLDKIKEGLEQPPTALTLQTLERPTFRVEIRQQQKLDELMATLNFKTTRAPAGGVYWDEVQRQMWPSVDNPLR